MREEISLRKLRTCGLVLDAFKGFQTLAICFCKAEKFQECVIVCGASGTGKHVTCNWILCVRGLIAIPSFSKHWTIAFYFQTAITCYFEQMSLTIYFSQEKALPYTIMENCKPLMIFVRKCFLKNRLAPKSIHALIVMVIS